MSCFLSLPLLRMKTPNPLPSLLEKPACFYSVKKSFWDGKADFFSAPFRFDLPGRISGFSPFLPSTTSPRFGTSALVSTIQQLSRVLLCHLRVESGLPPPPHFSLSSRWLPDVTPQPSIFLHTSPAARLLLILGSVYFNLQVPAVVIYESQWVSSRYRSSNRRFQFDVVKVTFFGMQNPNGGWTWCIKRILLHTK